VEVMDHTARATLNLPDELADDSQRHLVHPVILDAVLQLCVLAASETDRRSSQMFLPVGAARGEIRQAPPGPLLVRIRLSTSGTPETLTADAVLETEQGIRVATMQGLHFARADRAAIAAMAHAGNDLYDLAWECAPEIDGREAVLDLKAS